MTIFDRLVSWLRPAAYLGQNWCSLVGAVLTTASAITMLAFWLFEIMVGGGAVTYPYAGIILFLILPGMFVFGLALMPLGVWWRRRQLRSSGELPQVYPRIDLNEPHLRKALSLIGYATFANILIFTIASYRGVQYMDSVRFCGTTCHTVMQPEYTAYLNSSHSRVACADCHIGSGASWFVRSKVSGTKQVFAVAFHTYPRPIPSPVEQLRPARGTCEECHWPQRFIGSPVLVITHYGDDKDNTPATTVLLMKVGGESAEGMQGIHGHHLAPGVQITYIATDQKRQVIPQVTYTDATGKTVVYNSTDTKPTPEQLAQGEHRLMDCMDCHNRPTHTFELPGNALDEVMSQGGISTSLPFIKKEALEALKTDYPDRDTATQHIAQTLRNYYATNYPQLVSSQSSQIDSAVAAVQSIYLRNVFPAMNVTWGTYINDLGHTDYPGCFRCHDGNHTSKDGQTIPNDCDTCHHLLAVGEQNPKILSDLGLK
ncbi:MAG TPA: NapC/NirT family cytochrome c [Candidatus Acidoferrales bacterium]|nr:NapC/NirT family cytochrome c [Candidatus Acidoferrales bacterium]